MKEREAHSRGLTGSFRGLRTWSRPFIESTFPTRARSLQSPLESLRARLGRPGASQRSRRPRASGDPSCHALFPALRTGFAAQCRLRTLSHESLLAGGTRNSRLTWRCCALGSRRRVARVLTTRRSPALPPHQTFLRKHAGMLHMSPSLHIAANIASTGACHGFAATPSLWCGHGRTKRNAGRDDQL